MVIPDMVIMGYEKLIIPHDVVNMSPEKLIMTSAAVMMTSVMCHI